jgi:CMP/dCMP kinase
MTAFLTILAPFIIAVDGPSASGKGTLARLLADHYGLKHLDTGALYRVVGLAMLLSYKDLNDPVTAAIAAQRLDLSLLEHLSLRSEAAGQAASIISAYPEVRAALLKLQQDFAHTLPGAVLDGRDIGTVVCPDAQAKLFITADVAVRARRREQDLIASNQAKPYATILRDLQERDARDSNRAEAPLKPATDALILDTSTLTITKAVAAAVDLIDSRQHAMSKSLQR